MTNWLLRMWDGGVGSNLSQVIFKALVDQERDFSENSQDQNADSSNIRYTALNTILNLKHHRTGIPYPGQAPIGVTTLTKLGKKRVIM